MVDCLGEAALAGNHLRAQTKTPAIARAAKVHTGFATQSSLLRLRKLICAPHDPQKKRRPACSAGRWQAFSVAAV
jgi:hypothetical protein